MGVLKPIERFPFDINPGTLKKEIMVHFQFCTRATVSCFLIGALSGVLPLNGASALPLPVHGVVPFALERRQEPQAPPQPGTPAPAATPQEQPPASQDATPRTADQQPAAPATTSPDATAPKHHISPWVWVAIVAGVGVGVGAGIISGNSQAGRTATTGTSITINVGPGVSAGSPH